MKNFEDQLIAATILGQALPLEEAKAQVRKFLDLFDLVEELSSEEKYGAKEFHLDVRLKFKK